MAPSVSVLKSVVMTTLVAALSFGYRKSKPHPYASEQSIHRKCTPAVTAALCVGIVLGTLTCGYQNHGDVPTASGDRYDKERPFAQFRFESDGHLWDLGKGEYFVVLLSDSCDHCEKTMLELNELPLLLQDFPAIIGLFLGEEETLKELCKKVKPEYPTILIDPLTFFRLLGDATAPPRFVYIRNGKQIQHWDEMLPERAELAELLSGSRLASQ